MSAAIPESEIDDPDFTWFNVSEPLSLERLRGRMVILEFWTSCCINCVHVLTSLKKLEAEFGDDLAVIGVHSPKFSAEENERTVADAIARYDIRHPVVQDVDLRLWSRFGVRSWPTLIFISPTGKVLGQVTGEPDLAAMEAVVGEALEKARRKNKVHHEPLPLTAPRELFGRFLFPARLRPVPGPTGERRWAVADAGRHQIVVLNDAGVELFRVGDGQPGFLNGAGKEARFCNPQGVAATPEALFVADTFNHAIRRIDLKTLTVTTLAGTGRRGFMLPPSGAGLEVELASVRDLVVDGDLLYFANSGTHQLGSLDLISGDVRLLAGTGAEDITDGPALSAMLAQPSGLTLDPEQRILYFVDGETSAVRALALAGAGKISTLTRGSIADFGHANGPLGEALLQNPQALAWSPGLLWIADTFNHRIRRIDLKQGTIADVAEADLRCVDPECLPLREPSGIACVDPQRLLISDTGNHRIYEIRLHEMTARTWCG